MQLNEINEPYVLNPQPKCFVTGIAYSNSYNSLRILKRWLHISFIYAHVHVFLHFNEFER